ncbi:hypothetical protein MDOR_04760 [Mycolicibacterium doricum]|uniref:Uncharacterized protein n=1 Tax=Mycolicibacterium doricum TaxID=126673 RepID=A0A7I7VN33_9MYCO|nr:hypothetical protein MDOR_04560 [Mycolicibacterium doricum]BBZ06307.1 hypothetical protein MDOR_04760 [Mycolicibacterium doricum]
MVTSRVPQPLASSYGPVTFVAALVNILFVETAAVWYFLPWFALAIFVLPFVLIDLAIAAVLRSRPGVAGQVGRGMLIGLVAAPVALAVFLPGFLLVQAAGLV